MMSDWNQTMTFLDICVDLFEIFYCVNHEVILMLITGDKKSPDTIAELKFDWIYSTIGKNYGSWRNTKAEQERGMEGMRLRCMAENRSQAGLVDRLESRMLSTKWVQTHSCKRRILHLLYTHLHMCVCVCGGEVCVIVFLISWQMRNKNWQQALLIH